MGKEKTTLIMKMTKRMHYSEYIPKIVRIFMMTIDTTFPLLFTKFFTKILRPKLDGMLGSASSTRFISNSIQYGNLKNGLITVPYQSQMAMSQMAMIQTDQLQKIGL